MIVKGFKFLKTSYKKSQEKLTVVEEQLLTLSASYNTLIAEKEVAQWVLHDREVV